MENDIALKYLPWDTDQLNIPCGLIDLSHTYNEDSVTIQTKINSSLEDNKDIIFVTIKLASTYQGLIGHLIKSGAELIDTEITFVFSKDTILPSSLHDELSFKFVNKIASKYFVELADEMLLSRFYKDRRIPYAKANKLWRESIRNHCEGFADELLIAFYKDEPCGLVTLRFNEENDIYLHIVGVLKKWQRMNIGSGMIQQVINKYKMKQNIYVETQSNNFSAQKLYQKNGFILHHLTYIFHLWR